jgi:hypothetical protein
MTVTGDPFGQPPAQPWPFVPIVHGTQNPYPPTEPAHNTLAVLSPVFAVVLPPAGVVLGHVALVQIRRSGEQGRTPAIWGLILGYLLTGALLIGLIMWALSGPTDAAAGPSLPETIVSAAPAPQNVPPVVVTSVAPPPTEPRIKLDLAQVTVGTCAEIQKRDVGDDALDLFGVPCEHRQGVYTVVARVSADTNCQSTYAASPPDRSFALCLNEF